MIIIEETAIFLGGYGKKMENRESLLSHESPSFAILGRIFENPGATFDELFGRDAAKTTVEEYLDELTKSGKVTCKDGRYALTVTGKAVLTEEMLNFTSKRTKSQRKG